jgi:flagellar motility protein MotE (MotC chaperone)
MSVRLFAVLAILATGLIAIKALSITDEVLSLLDPAQPAWASGHGKKPKEKHEKKPKKSKSNSHASASPEPGSLAIAEPSAAVEAQVCKSLSFAEQAGLSENELRVVLRLSERREELDTRERDIKTREAVVTLSERQLDDRLAKIEGAITKFDQRIGLLDEQEELRVAAVVKTYENMDAEPAALIFQQLDSTVLLQVATRIKPDVLAAILSAMDPAKASSLTQRMAEQYARPASAEALLSGQSNSSEG